LENNCITLGSLFDGIGAFPLAASRFGIKPVWASEILPNAVSVTKRHFPEMEHLGDITKLDGGKIPPVSIICFGSPCQSFSVAAGNNRTGFAGKSGLFMEAIRIIKEMKSATHGKYPQLVLFENVFGLLSSGKGSYAGRDYQTALEAFCETNIPMPESGRWANAGMVRGRGFSLAWIVKDASKHFRVPQRRRRLFAVVDFTGAGNRAAEILFVTKSLSGYFEARESEGQGTAAVAESGVGVEDYGSAGFNGFRSVTGSIEYAEERAPCLNATMPPNIVSAYGETGRGYWQDRVQTIRAQGENRPSRPSNVVVVASGQANAEILENLAPTLTTQHEQPYLCAAFMAGQAKNAWSIAYSESVSPTLKGSPSGLNQVPCVCEPQVARTLAATCADRGWKVVAIHQNQQGELREADVAYTLGTNANATGRNAPVIVFARNQRDEVRDLNDVAGCLAAESGIKQQAYIATKPAANCLTPWGAQQAPDGGGRRNPARLVMTHPDVAGTLCASGAGMSRPAGQANETDLCVAYRSYDGYIVRRLTPLECERLMSLPDFYTEYGHDGRLISDSARYSLIGNSIVVNVLAYIMQNIAEVMGRGVNCGSD
jgi:DNA (cytosine-5)-methyltransferase 1